MIRGPKPPLNIDRTEAMISYIAEKASNLFKVKLMKMLWYSDVLSDEEKAILHFLMKMSLVSKKQML